MTGVSIWRSVRHLLMPSACLACRVPLAPERDDFCPACEQALLQDPFESCPRCCSNVGPHLDLTDGCSRCRDRSLAFERAIRLGPYNGILRDVILQMKQPRREGLAEAMGAIWARHAEPRLRQLNANVVVPVPLHWRRQWSRGFNQAEVLAESLAARLGIPCVPRALRRIRATPFQTSLAPSMRHENVRGAFQVRDGAMLTGRNILVVDDVLTTGSTAHEIARELRRNGASRVVVAVLAHDRA